VIAAIDGRAGLSTDKSQALMAPHRSQQFSTVLETVHQDTPKAPPPASRPAASQDTQGRVVSKRPGPDAPPEREASSATSNTTSKSEDVPSEDRADKSADTQPNEPERRETRRDDDTSNAITPDATQVRTPSLPQPQSAQQLAGNEPREGQVLGVPQTDATLAQGYTPSGKVGSTIQASLGRAAYNLSPHGVGEPGQPVNKAYAATAGAIAATALQPADPNLQAPQLDTHVVSVQEMVQLSNAARASMVANQDVGVKTSADTGESKHDLGRADTDPAQARNQILAQIGGAAGGVAAVQAQGAKSNAGQGDSSSLGTKSQSSQFTKEVKPVSVDSTGTPVSPSAAGLAAGTTTVGAAQMTRDGQSVQDGNQKLDPTLLNKIVQESRWMIRAGQSEVTIKLQPEHLGEMKLRVTHKDGDLTVQMTVDSTATKHLLDASLKDLRQQLQSENLAQGSLMLNVDVRQGGDSGSFAGFAKHSGLENGSQAIGSKPVEEAPQPGRVQPAGWSNSNISIYA
jgi:flagellar hook-length control protein FliK